MKLPAFISVALIVDASKRVAAFLTRAWTRKQAERIAKEREAERVRLVHSRKDEE